MTPEAPENAPGATLAVTLRQTTLERLREQVGKGEPQSRGPSKPVTGRACTTFWRCLTESCRGWGTAYELPCRYTANRPARTNGGTHLLGSISSGGYCLPISSKANRDATKKSEHMRPVRRITLDDYFVKNC